MIQSKVKLDMLQNKRLKENNTKRSYISDVEISRVPQSAPLGVSKTKSLDDAMVRQSLLLCCRHARACEVVSCKTSTGERKKNRKPCLE